MWAWDSKEDQSSAWHEGEKFQRPEDLFPFPGQVWLYVLCLVSQQ